MKNSQIEVRLDVEADDPIEDPTTYHPLQLLGIEHEIVCRNAEQYVSLRTPHRGCELGPVRRPQNSSFVVREDDREKVFEVVLAGIAASRIQTSYVNVFVDVGDPFGEERNFRDEAMEALSAVAGCTILDPVDCRYSYKGGLAWKEWEEPEICR